jgi:hypothetical protein
MYESLDQVHDYWVHRERSVDGLVSDCDIEGDGVTVQWVVRDGLM